MLRLARYAGERSASERERSARDAFSQAAPLEFVRQRPDLVVVALDRTFDSEPCGIVIHESQAASRKQRVLLAAAIPAETRASSLLEFGESADGPEAIATVEKRLSQILEAWSHGKGDKEASADLLQGLERSSRWHALVNEHRSLLRACIGTDLTHSEDYEAVKRVAGLETGLFGNEEMDKITDDFTSWLQIEVADEIDYAESITGLDSGLDHLHTLADLYDVNIEDLIDWNDVEKKRADLEAQEYEPAFDEDEFRERRGFSADSEEAAIDAMFDSSGEREQR